MNGLKIAEVSIRRDADGRYCLNDLHRAAGGEKRHQPSDWQRIQQTAQLIQQIEIEIPGIPGIQSKQGLGTFACKELVYAYAMWISPAFHLKVIRAYDALVSPAAPAPRKPQESNLAEQYKAAIPVAAAVVELGAALGWTLDRSQAAAVDVIQRKMGVDIGVPAHREPEPIRASAAPASAAQLTPMEQLAFIAKRGPQLFKTQMLLAAASGVAQTTIGRMYRFDELRWNPTTNTVQRVYEAIRGQEVRAGNPPGQMFLPLK